MRTTPDIDEDILQAARELGRRQKKTVGQVISELARSALSRSRRHPDRQEEPPDVLGLVPLPSRGGLITNEMIDRLREDCSPLRSTTTVASPPSTPRFPSRR